jgi:hypothetical protein
MCRSIKVLRRSAQPVTLEEISAAALQYVRKVSGYRQPSKANQSAFDSAVHEIASATARLLHSLPEGEPKRRPQNWRPSEGGHAGMVSP